MRIFWLACLLGFFNLATFKVVSIWVLTYDSANSWQLYRAALLEDHAIMTQCPTQSDYPDTDLTCVSPILEMPMTG